MSAARPSPEEIRKYFLDPPDPAELAHAEAGLRDAERRMAEARARRPHPGTRKREQNNRLVVAGALAFVSLVMSVTGSGFLGFLGLAGAAVIAVRAYLTPKEREEAEREAAHRAWEDANNERERALRALREYHRRHALAEPKPSDGQMDRVLRQDIELIKSRALITLNVHPDDLVRPAYMARHRVSFDASAPSNSADVHDPFVVYGPAYGAGYAVWSAAGADGRRRYSRYEVMVICTTRYHLALYRCVLDTFTGALDEERTTEYHYNDVVAVHSESDPNAGGRIQIQPRPSQKYLFTADTERYFELVVSSGDRVRIVTGIGSRRTPARQGQAGAQHVVHRGKDPDFQAVADAVRMMLREKKGGVHSPPHGL
ncbi:hypothetical protein [Nonomuraea pusilla]|uniref:Uncharacterized protein n=1 Tax=Nonomuraea pusilla TaxID=46177 RepID=A0A1H8G867_9ACTN|nr:hypothetical protein [Nonomuraea pusilla]SEN40321.1 hypothetical protein SAMN05660976_07467 [Nonomuraea pusilla]